MSLTNTKQYMGTRKDILSRKGSCDTQWGNSNDDHGNSKFANSSSLEKKKTNAFSTFQSQKADLDLSSSGRFSMHYCSFVKTITMIIFLILLSTNIEQTQEFFC